MESLLADKCAVITGAGRGQGREIALAMAKMGVKVIVNDLGGALDGSGADRAPADLVAAEIIKTGGTAVADYNDVSDFDSAENLIGSCVNHFGKMDILVNCAGISGQTASHFWEVNKRAWDKVIAVNLSGTFNTCRHALGQMVKQKAGRIINFASPSWLGIMAGAYTASKGAIVSLSLGIAQDLELEGYQITCNVIVPLAETRMSPRRGGGLWERCYEAGLITRQLLKESSDPAGPEHIPPIVLFLATDEAAQINGQIFGASRGRVAVYSWPTETRGIYKDGVWTLNELRTLIPSTLAQGFPRARG